MGNPLLDQLPEFIHALEQQLEEDQKRWGDTWMHRRREGQEMRTKATFDNYFDQFVYAGTPVPWLKVAGNALICWVRDQKDKYDPVTQASGRAKGDK